MTVRDRLRGWLKEVTHEELRRRVPETLDAWLAHCPNVRPLNFIPTPYLRERTLGLHFMCAPCEEVAVFDDQAECWICLSCQAALTPIEAYVLLIRLGKSSLGLAQRMEDGGMVEADLDG